MLEDEGARSATAPQHVDVLLVDDDEGVHFLVSRYLRRSGITLHWCADGPSAHDFLRTHTVTLLLLDQRLSGASGDELLERWLADDLIGTATVSICSAEPPPSDVRANITALGATLLEKTDILEKDGVRLRLDAARARA